MITFLVAGDHQVGKSSLISNFCKEFSSNSKEAVNSEIYHIKLLEHHEKRISIKIWDLSADNPNTFQAFEAYGDVAGVVLMFSLADRTSFASISNWISVLRKRINKNARIVLVGNKKDLADKVIGPEEIQALSEEFKIKYYEISVFENRNIQEPFLDVLNEAEAQTKKGFLCDTGPQDFGGIDKIEKYMNSLKFELLACMEDMSNIQSISILISSGKKDKEEIDARLTELEKKVMSKSFVSEVRGDGKYENRNQKRGREGLQRLSVKKPRAHLNVQACLDEQKSTEHLMKKANEEKRNDFQIKIHPVEQNQSESYGSELYSALSNSMNASLVENSAAVEKNIEDEVFELKNKLEESEEKLMEFMYRMEDKIKNHNEMVIEEMNQRLKAFNCLSVHNQAREKPQDQTLQILKDEEEDVFKYQERSVKCLKPKDQAEITPNKVGKWKGRFKLSLRSPESPKTQQKNTASERFRTDYKGSAIKALTFNLTDRGWKDSINTKRCSPLMVNDYILSERCKDENQAENHPPQSQKKRIRSRYPSPTILEGEDSFYRETIGMEPSALSTQDEIALIWKTINTIIENTQDQMEKLRVNTNISEGRVVNGTILHDICSPYPTDLKLEKIEPKDVEREEEKSTEKQQELNHEKDLKAIIIEVKDDVHNQILGVHREFERELNSLRDMLFGHYNALSEKIHLENLGLRDYIDEKIDLVRNEIQSIVVSGDEEPGYFRDRSMSDGKLLKKPVYPISGTSLEQEVMSHHELVKEEIKNQSLLTERNLKQIETIQEEMMKSVWETINLMSSRLTKVEKNVNSVDHIRTNVRV